MRHTTKGPNDMINDYGIGAEQADKPVLGQLAQALDNPTGRVEVRIGEEDPIELPPSAIEAFARVATYLADADFVAVEPLDNLLTTQEVADLLKVSRPYLISKLLGTEIPFETRGPSSSHRRVKLSDVIRYRDERAEIISHEGKSLLRDSRAAYVERMKASQKPARAARAREESTATF